MKINIREPFYGAWKKYGWKKGVWGVGIKQSEIMKAGIYGEKIYITLRDEPTEYMINPKMALKHGKLFKARFDTTLRVIPLNKFEKVSVL